MRKFSRRAINRGAHQLAVSTSVVLGFLVAFFMYYGIDLDRHASFLFLPFAFGILGVLATYATIRTVGWLVSFAFPRSRRHRREPLAMGAAAVDDGVTRPPIP